MISPSIAFVAWIPISLFFFKRYSLRVALLVNFIAGWAVLPSAAFAPTNIVFPYWILGTCLPPIHFFTKASVTGITCLLGILLFDRSFRPVSAQLLGPAHAGLMGRSPVISIGQRARACRFGS
jgi:hypothetical protein